MKTKEEMINDCLWLGAYVKFYQIGEYSIVEYKPKVFKNGSPVHGSYEEVSNFHSFIGGINTNRSYNTLDECLAGCIAIKHDGGNTRADVYFIKSITNESNKNETD